MKNQLNKIAKDTNVFLKRYIQEQGNSKLIYAMKYGLFPGGKKIRSKILIDIGSLFSINYHTLIAIGAAVECIHAYSLIHDDLPCMDNDNMRRGKPSTHIKFGESTAVLAGNSLLTMAFEILTSSKLNLSDKIKVKLVDKLSTCSGHLGIAGGQYLDLDFEKKKVSKKQIIDMEIKKTGKLFSFCCAVPAIIKEKSLKEIKFFESIFINPISNTKSTLDFLISSVAFFPNSSREIPLSEIHSHGILYRLALLRMYAPSLFEITILICASIFPSSIASIIACKSVPFVDPITPSFSILFFSYFQFF